MTKQELLSALESHFGLTLKPSDESGEMFHLVTPTGIAIMDVYIHDSIAGLCAAFADADWTVRGEKLDGLAAHIAGQLHPNRTED